MNTTTAAQTAGVTADTIRTWCRTGAVAAVKQAGRWIIERASLITRMRIGAMKAGGRLVHYRCHSVTQPGAQGITRVDGLCPACRKTQQGQNATQGPLATRAQVNYLLRLIGAGADRAALEALERGAASRLIGELKNTGCSCASARYSRICTC